jgi:hypothetical protein
MLKYLELAELLEPGSRENLKKNFVLKPFFRIQNKSPRKQSLFSKMVILI